MIFLFKAAKHAFFLETEVSGADGVTIRVGVAEDDFEGAGHKDEAGYLEYGLASL
jgi:hypothetical protein